MKIFNLSMECFPVAKVGGLADVVGALPKYLNRFPDVEACVVMPWHNKPFVHEHWFETVFEGIIYEADQRLEVTVMKQADATLGFDLFLVRIPGLLDRENPYGYWDESQQFLAFQHAVLHWLTSAQIRPDILHCHDYHTGLVPFMIEHCPEFSFLRGVPTVGTIHNGEYQGQMRWQMADYFPWFEPESGGLLDWDGKINPLACMIKCCHAFTAVSGGYLEELMHSFRGLEGLVRHEQAKAIGIINGIDTEVWNPATDPYLSKNFSISTFAEGKRANKEKLCGDYGLNPDLPLFSFIGRFAYEKGADLLPDIVRQNMVESAGTLNIMILGSGDPSTEHRLAQLAQRSQNFALDLGYKEYLSHEMYAGSDFLLMPSRVEPCGLNQMYAMRYGTVPIVRYTGGLRDTVRDISVGGSGFHFDQADTRSAVHAIQRALHCYHQAETMEKLIESNMSYDFSWENSAQRYLDLYHQLTGAQL